MELLIIRHAIAEDREAFARTGQDDGLRPLTPGGARKMQRVARGLVRAAPSLELLATSPLVRAVQTAEIVAAAYGVVEPLVIEQLTPEARPADFLRWLRGRGARDALTIGAVGHEPALSTLATWLLTGEEESRVELKKGAACLLRFDRRPAPGTATLVWALAPGHLRRLAS
ncbi:MAG: histidine phosphatase family protein [Gemmatimonadota bacterium]|nr:histidine phosphatase family protein [Gemmatimonadota bacterium]